MVRDGSLRWFLIFAFVILIQGCSLFDFLPPEIKIISPKDGATVYGAVILEAEVKDAHLDRTEVFVNGNKEYGCESEYISYSYNFSRSGKYTIKLKAFDKAGNWNKEEVSFTVVPVAPRVEVIEITSSTVTLEWSKNTDSDFLFYGIYRDDSPGVNPDSKAVAIIGNQDDTTYKDSLLSPHHTYYYNIRVYNIDSLSAESNEIEVTTNGLSGLAIGIDPRNLELSQGSSFFISIWIESVEDLFGTGFEITYDNTVIEADSAVMGDFLGPNIIFFDHYSPDTVSIALTRKSGDGGVSGYGTLVDLYFHCIGRGTTPLNFTPDIALNKEDGMPVNGFDSMAKWEAKVTVE
ncbi:hypothetical protein KAW48_06010 [candidate division WOR-3 bacterium]|nr:hypothetical protein [candidate division WOR-3 bacterium]